MKKTLLLMMALMSLAVADSLYAQKKLVFEQQQTLNEEGMQAVKTHCLYGVDGLMRMKYVEQTEETVYAYDEAGRLVEETSYEFDESVQNRLSEKANSHRRYYYGANGLVEKEEVYLRDNVNQTISYAYDEKQNVKSMVVIASSGGAVQIVYQNTYDAAGNLSKVEVINTMQGVIISTTLYTYDANGRVSKEESMNNSGLMTRSKEYVYDGEGLLVSCMTYDYEYNMVMNEDESISYELAGQNQTVTTYEYGDVNQSLVPQNLTVAVAAGNVATLTWQAPSAGAGKYVVFYDDMMVEVEGTTFTTPSLADATRSFFVASVANGAKWPANMAVLENVVMEDKSKVGAQDVRLNGEITHEVKQETNSSGVMEDVNYYNIPVAWTLPEGANPQSFRIYCFNENERFYFDVEDGTARSATLSLSEKQMKGWRMGTGEFYYNIEIKVVAIYETGTVDPANTIKLEESPAVGIERLTFNDERLTIYDLTGRRVTPFNAQRSTGIYIVNGKKVFVK